MRKIIVFNLILLILAFVVTSCQTSEPTSPTEVIPPDNGEPTDPIEPDPVDIDELWRLGPHSDTFVVDADGSNSTCARCHAPVNWLPSMDDIPASCQTCKFEVSEPPPFIPEEEWVQIGCVVCHKVDKNDEVLPGFAWLEIAQIGEYAELSTTTQLCQKCHIEEVDLTGHHGVEIEGVHHEFVCTACHNPHDTSASCGATDCHHDVTMSDSQIDGHDEDHLRVSCVACHDAGGMLVDFSEDLGVWTTLMPGSDGETLIEYTSHNIQLSVQCERCHYVDNPWDLSQVEQP
jgi:hypothetical protein